MIDMEKKQIDPKRADLTGTRELSKIDNLGRVECLGHVASAVEWLQMRGLRSRLVDEYFDRPSGLAPALERACWFTEHMHIGYSTIQAYASKCFGIASP